MHGAYLQWQPALPPLLSTGGDRAAAACRADHSEPGHHDLVVVAARGHVEATQKMEVFCVGDHRGRPFCGRMASMELCRLFVVSIGNLTKVDHHLNRILEKSSQNYPIPSSRTSPHEDDDGEVEHVATPIRSPRRLVLPAYWRSRRRLVADH